MPLSVYDKYNTDISKDVSIIWYNAYGKQIGKGNSLNGIEYGDTIYYSVILEEELGREYKEVHMQELIVDSMSASCQLQKIEHVSLAGSVSGTDIDKASVTINVKQMLNGKYEQTYSTITDEQGHFKIEVYDDITDITISGDGYFDASMHREGFVAMAILA